jgi:hypothetical protein
VAACFDFLLFTAKSLPKDKDQNLYEFSNYKQLKKFIFGNHMAIPVQQCPINNNRTT